MKKLMTVATVALASAAVSAAYGPYEDELPSESSEAKSFCADTGYVTLTKGDTAQANRTHYAFCYNGKDGDPDTSGKGALGEWSVSGAPQKGSKYYVGKIGSSRGVLCTDNSKGGEFHFQGSELVIGSYGRLQPMTKTSATNWIDNLYMLGGAQFYWTGAKSPLRGTAHIRRSSAASPVEFYLTSGLTIPCGLAFEGNADQCIAFKGGKADGEVVFTQDGDWSQFVGSVQVMNTTATGVTRVRFDTTELPARVTVEPNCEFKTRGNSVSMVGLTERTETPVDLDAGSTWTVGDFVVDANVTLKFADRTAKFVVTKSLTINPGGSLTIKLASDGFDMTKGDVEPIQGLISFGPDVVLTGVTADTFKYEGFVKEGAPTVTFALEQDEETGVTTLVARRKTVVERTSAEETTDPLSSHFWRAEKNAKDEFCWTDSQAPHEGADYYLSAGATPPGTGTAAEGFTFAGDSLIIKGNSKGVGFITPSGSIPSTTAFWDYKDLRIIGDYVWFRSYNGNQPSKTFGGTSLSTWELRGKVTITEGTSLHHSPYNSRVHYVTGEHFGSGSIELSSYQGASAKGSNTGRIMFSALNTNFLGRIYFDHAYYEKKDKNTQEVLYTIPDEEVHVWLYMNDGRNLGGPLPAFSYNAISVNDWGRLVALDDVSSDLVLDQANRGIWVNWVGQFDVPKETTTLTIKNPITLTGNLYKRGAGTLMLASTLRFKKNHVVDEIGTPQANSNLVTVTEGALGVASARALDGAAITVSDGASLVIRESATDDELAQKGIVNVLGDFEAARIATDAEDGKIAVTLDTSALSSDAHALTFGLVTLNTEAEAGALMAKLAVSDRIRLGKRPLHRESLEVAKNANETWTIKARYEYTGLSLIFR